jgi:hypothetical protein
MTSGQDRDTSRRQERKLDLLIEQTEEALVNTRRFLDQLDPSNSAAKEEIGAFVEDLKLKIHRLKSES